MCHTNQVIVAVHEAHKSLKWEIPISITLGLVMESPSRCGTSGSSSPSGLGLGQPSGYFSLITLRCISVSPPSQGGFFLGCSRALARVFHPCDLVTRSSPTPRVSMLPLDAVLTL